MLNLSPLITPDSRTVAWRDGALVSTGQFALDLSRLVAALPDRGHVVNLCEDRYLFLLGMAAAMERLQVNLLLPNRTPELILQIREQLPDLYLLCDRPLEAELQAAGLPALDINTLPAGDVPPSQPPAWPPEQTLALAFTSGSTGIPRPNRKTWQCLLEVARVTAKRLGMDRLAAGSVVATVPAQHMYGLEASVMLPLQSGWALCASRPFFPADIGRELQAVPGPRILVTTPVHIRALVMEKQVLPELAMIVSATAPLSVELARQAEAMFDAPVMEIFGFTELGSAATRRTVDQGPWQLLDGLRFAGHNDRNEILAPYIDGPTTVSDVIERVDEQRFYLRGRDSDMVNIAGKRASLAELNLRLNDVNGVVDGVMVVTGEDGETVSRLAAFVVAPGLSTEDISAALRRSLDPVFVPRPVIMLQHLPRNDTGKLPRAALDELIRTHLQDN